MELSDERLRELYNRHASCETGKLLNTLSDVVAECRYLPADALEKIAAMADVPLRVIDDIVSRSDMFSTTPVGDHVVVLCDGTVCHSRGSVEMLQALEFALGIRPGETTADGRFTLFAVACLGCCEQAPILLLDDALLPQMRLADIGKALDGAR